MNRFGGPRDSVTVSADSDPDRLAAVAVGDRRALRVLHEAPRAVAHTARPVLAPILMVGLLVGPVGWNIPWIVNSTAALAPGEWTLGDPAWHPVFLAGITSAGLALVRDSRRGGPVALLVVGAAALIAGAALQ